MKITIAVTSLSNDEKRNVVAEFADFIAWETAFDKSLGKFEVDMKLRDLTWLAWHSEHRKKTTSLLFEEWLNDVALIEPVLNGDVIVPLESNQHIG
jgi:hypothetical protein